MFREVAQIVLAISLSSMHGQSNPSRIAALAATIQTEANKPEIDIDPIMIVAIVAHESQWNERAISSDREDFGLMQVRNRYYYNGLHSNWLLDGVNNIKVGTNIIKKSKDICRTFLGREPKTQEWLACYTGSCTVSGMCKPTKLTKVIEDYSLCMQDVVENGTQTDCKVIYWPNLKNNK